ncbi:MAG: hypothetical protein PHS74_00730 [Lachnospiraceae bacterium]|nr:hypothetical protein [Lachnospiraceae bacterium]
MLNEDRIILMTRMASYEENEGKKNVSIGSYFRGDYIGLQVIKSVISATIAFALLVTLAVTYDIGSFMQDIYKLDLLQIGKNLLIVYVVMVSIYIAISYFIYSYRYNVAKRSLKCYFNNLKELNSLYEEEKK